MVNHLAIFGIIIKKFSKCPKAKHESQLRTKQVFISNQGWSLFILKTPRNLATAKLDAARRQLFDIFYIFLNLTYVVRVLVDRNFAIFRFLVVVRYTEDTFLCENLGM